MALLRKKKTPSTTRRRLSADNSPRTLSYDNTPHQMDKRLNTGRQAGKERSPAKRPKNLSVKSFWARRFGLIILVTAILVCAISVLSLSPRAKILPLQAGQSNSFLRDPATYQAAADKLLSNSILDRNKVTIDTGKFNKEMMKQFPELSSVSVALPLLAHRPVVYLQSAQPALVLAADNGSYVIDTRGKALLAADNSASQNKLPQVIDQSGLQVKLNQQALTASDVNFIQTLIAQLAAKKITVSSLVLPHAADELDAHIAGQTYYVKFNLQDGDPRQQSGTYLATAAYLQRKSTPAGKYIDVRVPGRAYYQ